MLATSHSVSKAHPLPSFSAVPKDTNQKPQRISQYSSHLRTAVDKVDTVLTTWQGKKNTYPSAVVLATTPGSFGQISASHSFLKEPTFENLSSLLVKSSFLSSADHSNLLLASLTINTLWVHMVKFKDLDFSPLQTPDLDYLTQTSIPQDRVDMFTACAIHYDFDLSSVIRFTGGNYTNAHLKAESILAQLAAAGCDPNLMNELKRVISEGCPSYFNATSTQETLIPLLNMVIILL